MLSDKGSDTAHVQGGTGQAWGGEGAVVMYHQGRWTGGLRQLSAMSVLP